MNTANNVNIWRKGRGWRPAALALCLMVCAGLFGAFGAGKADASTNTDGDAARPYLYWESGTFGGVAKKEYIHVYAKEGETICLGSNVFDSGWNLEGSKVEGNGKVIGIPSSTSNYE